MGKAMSAILFAALVGCEPGNITTDQKTHLPFPDQGLPEVPYNHDPGTPAVPYDPEADREWI